MDVYSGSIAFPNDSQIIQDIHFTCSKGINEPAIPQHNLRFLTLVDPSRIPLYLAAGPSLNVWTENATTEEWFARILLRDYGQDDKISGSEKGQYMPWWKTFAAQSNVGLLLQTDHDHDPAAQPRGPRITEVLIYGSIHQDTQPAISSLPSHDQNASLESHQASSSGKELRVYALPLSSDLLYHPSTQDILESDLTPLPPLSADVGVREAAARFLGPLFPRTDSEDLTTGQKRQRLDTLFDDAAERRKKAKRKGGENVSHTMAHVERAVSIPRAGSVPMNDSNKSATLAKAQTKESAQQRHLLPRQGLSRSSSLSSVRSVEDPRPISQKKPSVDLKRSSLYRVSSMTAIETTEGPEVETIEAKNKGVMSRIVMAGMRIYGLQQQRRKLRHATSLGPSNASNASPGFSQSQPQDTKESTPDTESGVDEYKLIYHQAFKGACFAFRSHIHTSILKQDTMRDVVDKLLAIFCTDPFSVSTLSTQDDSTGFGQDPQAEESPFVPASGGGKKSLDDREPRDQFSTPSVRRRYRDALHEDEDAHEFHNFHESVPISSPVEKSKDAG
ncbi:MAG: hypothetical protein M1819_004322 [Sarea resinae]|nr:MAG: hypothetical protein M1819_004322 [Sarea resinae]